MLPGSGHTFPLSTFIYSQPSFDFGFLYGGNSLLLNDGNGECYPGDADGSDIVTACMGASVADMDGDAQLDIYSKNVKDKRALTNRRARRSARVSRKALP